MKDKIHPQYYNNSKVICACGNTWETGSTQKEIHTEICSACHPFYTGKQKLVDSARRVEKFQERAAKKTTTAKTRIGKKVKRATRDSKRKSISEKPKKLEIKKLETRNAKKVNRVPAKGGPASGWNKRVDKTDNTVKVVKKEVKPKTEK